MQQLSYCHFNAEPPLELHSLKIFCTTIRGPFFIEGSQQARLPSMFLRWPGHVVPMLL